MIKILLLALVLQGCITLPPRADLVFTSTFESGKIQDKNSKTDGWSLHRQSENPESIAVI